MERKKAIKHDILSLKFTLSTLPFPFDFSYLGAGVFFGVVDHVLVETGRERLEEANRLGVLLIKQLGGELRDARAPRVDVGSGPVGAPVLGGAAARNTDKAEHDLAVVAALSIAVRVRLKSKAK